MSQFVTCKFRIADTRTYTYANEGEPVAPGDQVKVADSRSDGWKRVYVVDVDVPEPSFPCKPILGLFEETKPDDLLADGEDADLHAHLENRA